MITLATRTHVTGLRGRDVTAFLARCDDDAYRRWWPGTHLSFHTLDGRPGDVGSRVHMDEYIGDHRVRMDGDIVEFVPGRRLVWRGRRGVPLPVTLTLEFEDDATGVWIDHTLQAGWPGLGSVFDPLLRSHFSADFAAAMDEHVRTEFPRLRDLLHPAQPVATPR